MSSVPDTLIQRLWNYCNILRDDGLSYGDYVEQLTYLLFLKMAEEHSKPPFLHLAPLSKGYDWSALETAEGEAQLELYERILRRLGQRKDIFGVIYRNALSKFRDPAKFRKLVAEIAAVEWAAFDSDIKGRAYEGLLERTASDGKAGAGQYFTPRPLVDAITEVMRPTERDMILDPACGTGGFLLAALRFVSTTGLSAPERRHFAETALHGTELAESVARLCLMNLVLHGIGGSSSPIEIGDALAREPVRKYDLVLANPPFGKKSAVGIGDEASSEDRNAKRQDFWATTNNKQINFLQHIFNALNETGRAAVIVPDNVLFEGGAGETVRRELLSRSDVHTLLRLPTGIFYAQGIKSNVLFFEKAPANQLADSRRLWIYDLRTDYHFTLKEKTLRRSDLSGFVEAYCADDRSRRHETDRFKSYSYKDLLTRDRTNLDIAWLPDPSIEKASGLSNPLVPAGEIAEELEAALAYFREIESELKSTANEA